MLPPLGVSWFLGDGNWRSFAESFLGLLFVGGAVWWPVRASTRELRVRDGFLVVSLFWIVLGIAGAVPFVLASRPDLTLTDAVFEAVSGFTTTGATVLIGLDAMPPSLLYYRQQIQWFGGLGMIVLAVALLPMLKIGGMQLLRAETPGPVKDAKLTPRITETAKILWLIYLIMTVACGVCYWLAGMSVFDAVSHSLSTLSTGGFSTHDASLAFFDSAVIETIAIVFMVLGGVNFSLHYLVWQRRSLAEYIRDPECKAFIGVLTCLILLYTVALWWTATKPDVTSALRAAAFQVASLQTSTGFVSEDFTLWPAAIPVLLILFSFLGGCAGSTAGGMKIIRWVLLWKQGRREVTQLLHPAAVLPVKLGEKPVSARVIEAVWGFFAVYVLSFGALMLALLFTGEDQVTAFSAIATCMNNMGPGLGAVTANFTTVSSAGK